MFSSSAWPSPVGGVTSADRTCRAASDQPDELLRSIISHYLLHRLGSDFPLQHVHDEGALLLGELRLQVVRVDPQVAANRRPRNVERANRFVFLEAMSAQPMPRLTESR